MAKRPPPPTPVQSVLIHPAMYYAARSALAIPQIAGLGNAMRFASRAGRAFGSARFNRKRVERAMGHIEQAFPELDEPARRELALRSYSHLFELGVELTTCQRLISEDAWPHHIRLTPEARRIFDVLFSGRPVILITGHCGNWEVLGFTLAMLGFSMHAVYRPLDARPLDRWVRESRSRRGLKLVDKFGAVQALPRLINDGAIAFVADQNAGDRAMFVPYFGRLTSTYKSIGLLALQTRATIAVGAGIRLEGSGRVDPVRQAGELDYLIHAEDVIEPEDYEAAADPLFYLTARYRLGLERIVRRAPEQYLWMHRMWKSRPRHEKANKPFPGALREKLGALPWLTDGDVEALVDRSDRDRAFLAEHALDRLP